jgi:hypothetical protein
MENKIVWGEGACGTKEKRNEYILFVRNTKERYDLGYKGIYGWIKMKLICRKWAGARRLN